MKIKFTREEKSWILYDVGNSAFVLVMVTAIVPIFFKDIAASHLPGVVSTSYLGFANSAASLILALSAPVLGAIADYNRKRSLFLFFLCTGLIFNFGMAFAGSGQWLLCLILFILARIGWAGANIFYDAFLPDITSRDRMHQVSAAGYGYGYIGSVIPFLLVIGLILSGGMKDGIPELQTRLGFVIVGFWWLLLSLPAMRHLKQHHALPHSAQPIRESFKRLYQTFREARKHRQVFLFLFAYFFYIDGVSTITSMSTAYGRDLGFGVTLLIGVLLIIQIIAFPFAILFGRLTTFISTRKVLLLGITIYCIATLLAFFLASIEDMRLKTMLFWIIAIMIGAAMGGIQSVSRSYFGQLIPPEKAAQFFGLYNISGKFAAITGPFMMGLVGQLTGETRWGVLSILLLFTIGGLILLAVRD